MQVLGSNFHFSNEGCAEWPAISDHENYFACAGQNVPQGFSSLSDILSPCQTFSPVDDKYQCSFLLSWWTFYVYWILLDKMSGKVWALCRTSAEVCWTCPADFAITGPPWVHDGQVCCILRTTNGFTPKSDSSLESTPISIEWSQRQNQSHLFWPAGIGIRVEVRNSVWSLSLS